MKNKERNTYGVFYSINGDAASQSHFYLTDSLQNFVTGSLYFDVKPNFDSIYPAVVYLRRRHHAPYGNPGVELRLILGFFYNSQISKTQYLVPPLPLL